MRPSAIPRGPRAQPYSILLAVLLALLAYPILGLRGAYHDVASAALALLVIAATLAVLRRAAATVFWGGVVLALPVVMGVVFGPGALAAVLLDESVVLWPFLCLAAGGVTVRVLGSENADTATIVGSVCAYLMIALAFASLYLALEVTWPGSFRFPDAPAAAELMAELSYFSIVTLTTLGYGDTVPASELARAFVILQSVVGILYPSVVIARLVSLATSGGGRPFEPRAPGPLRPGRFELLLAAEIVILVLGPFEGNPAADTLLRVLTTVLLVAALYAGSSHRVTRATGIVLAVLSTLGSWWPSEAPWVAEGALLAQTLFLALVSGSLARWLSSETRVTRDLLLAATSLYLLLGLAWSSLYRLIELRTPGSFVGPEGDAMLRPDLIYYSFMTLTTTGFGDFLPVSRAAQQMANLEALVGILFPTLLVARLVSLYRTE